MGLPLIMVDFEAKRGILHRAVRYAPVVRFYGVLRKSNADVFADKADVLTLFCRFRVHKQPLVAAKSILSSSVFGARFSMSVFVPFGSATTHLKPPLFALHGA